MTDKFQITTVSITTAIFLMLMFIPVRSYSSVPGSDNILLSDQDDTLRKKALQIEIEQLNSNKQRQIDSLKRVIAKIDSIKNEVGTDTLKLNQQIDSLKIVISEIEANVNKIDADILTANRQVDSLNIIGSPADSFEIANISINKPHETTMLQPPDSLSGREIKQWLKEQRYEEKRILRIEKDSIKAVKDSIRWESTKTLETYVLPDSLWFKRIVVWNHKQDLNNITVISPDTTYNENFNDHPFMKKDVGATYLGVSGSATQLHNFFKRDRLDIFPFFEPYLIYSNTAEDIPFYNVKTPYTELGYWGTLFANRDKEETNIKFMHTQNFTPQLNLGITYKRFGAKGLLDKENTDNRTFSLTSNYLGKRYVMHAGYIFQGITRKENGGILDDTMILDESKAQNGEFDDTKTLAIALQSADSRLKRNTLFLTHTYGIPIRFSKREKVGKEVEITGLEEIELQGIGQKQGQDHNQRDTLNRGTITYFGHSFEYSTYYRKYTDQISQSNNAGADYYNNIFLMGNSSYDSIRVNRLENKLFIRLQPWAQSAIISRLDGGIGHQFLNIYRFRPEYYLTGLQKENHSNIYTYFGASGNFKQYFRWNATAKYDLIGYYANNFRFDAQVGLSLFPVKEGIHITGKLSIEDRRPNWFNDYYYSNHFHWSNDFDNITETRIEGSIDIPHFKTTVFIGNSLINNYIYYGLHSNIAQHNDFVNVFSAYLQKDFKVGPLHMKNRILFQKSTNEEIVPLPMLSANLRYFFEFNLVKNVLRAQVGADVTFNTKYYAQSYNAALGVFHNQKDRQIGEYPYIDAFINFQWKRAAIFVKLVNVIEKLPGLSNHDYFSANHYIRPMFVPKFGIYWPFYVN